MLRKVSPVPDDQIDAFSDPIWDVLKDAGDFYAADAGDVMLELGQTDSQLIIILAGKATLIYFEDGAPQPTAIFRSPGEVLHHAGMHLKTPNPFRIDAAEPTRIVLIDRTIVYELISCDISFAEFLFKDLSGRFMVALEYLREQRQEPLINRLAKRLLMITNHRPSVEFTQAELAGIMAVTRISISKAIKLLEEDGLVRRAERSLIVVDRNKLKTWLNAQGSEAELQ